MSSSAITALPLMKEVPGHHDLVPFWLTGDMFGGMPVEIAGGAIAHLVGKPVARLHTHEVDEVYLLLSPSPGGARIEITCGDRTVQLDSPAVFHVPAGTKHQFVTLRAEPGSYCLGILLGNTTR